MATRARRPDSLARQQPGRDLEVLGETDVVEASPAATDDRRVNRSPLDDTFSSLPANAVSPSQLDDNPRYLRLKYFRSQILPSQREIRVYLPDAYLKEPLRRFPVFYLHDGQNLFDGRASYVADRTWRAGETADGLTALGQIEPVILVGVDNTGTRRMAEYTPTRDPRMGGGAGPRYGRMLVEELKPLIDRTFRTQPEGSSTGLGGSSLGGLITLALGIRYPEVFHRLAVLSPSVWWHRRSILNLVSDANPEPRPKIWLDMGTAEGLRHLRDTDLLAHRLEIRGWTNLPGPAQDLTYFRVEGACHEENAWANRFDKVLRFLFPA